MKQKILLSETDRVAKFANRLLREIFKEFNIQKRI